MSERRNNSCSLWHKIKKKRISLYRQDQGLNKIMKVMSFLKKKLEHSKIVWNACISNPSWKQWGPDHDSPYSAAHCRAQYKMDSRNHKEDNAQQLNRVKSCENFFCQSFFNCFTFKSCFFSTVSKLKNALLRSCHMSIWISSCGTLTCYNGYV